MAIKTAARKGQPFTDDSIRCPGTSEYPTGLWISDAQIKAVPVQRYAFQGE